MKPSDINIAELVPHSGNMILIDELIAADTHSATAKLTVRNEGLFGNNPQQVPAWVGIEYMAQTIAAWAGYLARLQNEKVRIGFLLGTRKYTSNVSHFTVGDTLSIHIQKNFGEESGLGSFNCVINGENILIESSLNVFQPNDEQIRELMEAAP
jgi:predicted hotdog family 3-hydroxylacyl-ACP dehydratase